jgi:hypothetical protein
VTKESWSGKRAAERTKQERECEIITRNTRSERQACLATRVELFTDLEYGVGLNMACVPP